ncbi:pyridoxamine 5'-phosphate oxidase family protein [Candidatus Saccharibacteria bacterium]|nr:pyridoxamine 5'-phosphate oxidase family protein [Candidatus Saccharibacteria bacterium]
MKTHVFDEILDGVRVGSLATVQQDGRPWNTPLHLAFDEENVYWLSSPETVHSKNIAERPQISIVIWSPDKSSGLKGIYIQSTAQALAGEAAEAGRAVYAEVFGGITPHLAAATVYKAKIGDKNTAASRGKLWYFDGDNTL